MNSPATVFAITVIQQGVLAMAWAILWRLDIDRRAARAWMVFTLMSGASFALIALRGIVPDWASWNLGNAIGVAGLAAMREGVQNFVGRRPSTALHLGLFVATAAVLQISLEVGTIRQGIIFDQLMCALLLWSSSWMMLRELPREFGLRITLLCAVPPTLFGVMQAVRAVASWYAPNQVGVSMIEPTVHNTIIGLVMMGIALLLNLGLLALVAARMVGQLRYLTRHDAMTRLLNRRAIDETLVAEVNQLDRRGGQLALIVVDIDHFKSINDRFGHPAGDLVLKEVARRLREVSRVVDHVARAGGEEFWILLPDTDRDGVAHVAQRILLSLRDSPVAVAGQALQITASIGVALAQGDSRLARTLIQRADGAMYRAKEAGRNRIEFAQP